MSTPTPAELRYARLAEIPLREIGPRRGKGAASIWAPLRDIVAHSEMLDLLVRRDLKAKYKDSTLGFFWSLARPLMQLAIYFVVVGQFLSAARGIPDFAVYIFTGLIAVGLFTEIVTGATGSVVANSGLVKKVYVPRELFPLASVGSSLFNFGVQLVVLVAATIAVGGFPWHLEIAYVLPALAILVVYGTAFGLLGAALNVYFRDVQYLFEVLTMVLFWASPVVYSWAMVNDLLPSFWVEVYTDNPLTLAVLGFQKAFWVAGADAAGPDALLLRMGVALVVGVGLLAVCYRSFLKLQGDFAQAL